MSGRSRSFDYDEAKRLRADGLTYAEIGKRLGVSGNAAAMACDPAFRKRQLAAAKKGIENARHPCFGGCGALVWGHISGRTGYCPTCLGARRNIVRHGTETEYSQGCRCEPCRLAASAAKRRRRVNSRVPCSHGCGTLVDSINRSDNTKPLECHRCANKRIVDTLRSEGRLGRRKVAA